MQSMTMRLIVTDVALSVCASVCLSVCLSLSVGHNCEPYKNWRTDRDAVWGVHLGDHKNRVLGGGPDSSRRTLRLFAVSSTTICQSMQLRIWNCRKLLLRLCLSVSLIAECESRPYVGE